MDLISRQAAIEALGDKPLAWTEGEYELGLQNQWQADVDALKDLPSAQPEPPEDICGECDAWNKYKSERKTGRWIGWLEPGNENYHCSACGTAWYPEDLYLGGNDYPKYCPECGAQMENWQSYPEEGT